PTFNNYIPHDLVHLVVEAAFGLRHGFWGRVDDGVDPARVNAEANRMGGANKYAAYGADQVELMTAEVLAATQWGDSSLSDGDILGELLRKCPKLSPVSVERIADVRSTLDSLCMRWIELGSKGALRLDVDFADLGKSFRSL